MKGSYLLLIELEQDTRIPIGRLGEKVFQKGFYLYVGSALNGLEQRIKRHLREKKKNHWHIDSFLETAKIKAIYYKENVMKEECIIAQQLDKKLTPIHSFGCSDCTCNSHLFFGTSNELKKNINQLHMNLYSSDANH